jgi:predicted P-loop ATPase
MMADVIDLQSWKGLLQNSKQGYKKNMTNLMMFLRNIRSLGQTIRWNELAQRVEWHGLPLVDHHLVDIRLILETENFEPTVSDVLPAVMRHARENAFHPVRDYLNGLEWDGVQRLDRWLQSCMGATDTAFTRMVGRKTLIAAVARAFKPGCKVDTVLILEGPQGIKKSSAIAALFGKEWTAESVNLFDQHNKMVMSMMGAWVVELAEFIAIQKKDQNAVKGMLSMRSDRVVLPYAKMASDHPRQCIFFGTINPGETGYLTDTTGNRRYWPVEVARAELDLIEARRDQLWAEAAHAYGQGESWWLEGGDQEKLAQEAVNDREEYDVWDEILTEKLITQGVLSTSLASALQALGVPYERMDKRVKDRAAECLRRIGYRSKIGKERDADGSRKSVVVFYREDMI